MKSTNEVYTYSSPPATSQDSSGGRDGHIEAVAVVDFVELVLWLDVAQLGIGEHGIRPI